MSFPVVFLNLSFSILVVIRVRPRKNIVTKISFIVIFVSFIWKTQILYDEKSLLHFE